MKAIPFIYTMLNEEYRILVNKKFNHLELESLFNNFKLKDMVGWHKVVDYNTNVQILFYGHDNPYKIKNPNLISSRDGFWLPYPQNIDNFICDCQRCLIDLSWNETLITIDNRIHFMKQSEIGEYVKNLLNKIEKS